MWPRFSLRQLLGLVVFVAIACSALLAPSAWLAGALVTLTMGLLAFAVLAAIGKTGRARYFWIGFALTGWGYLWLAEPTIYEMGSATRTNLVTNELLWLVWNARYPDSPWAENRRGGMGGGMFMVSPETSDDFVNVKGSSRPDAARAQQNSPVPPPLSYEDYQELSAFFFGIGHSLWALLFAYLGGCLTRAFYDRRPCTPTEGGTASR